jgi:hypothetical protein
MVAVEAPHDYSGERSKSLTSSDHQPDQRQRSRNGLSGFNLGGPFRTFGPAQLRQEAGKGGGWRLVPDLDQELPTEAHTAAPAPARAERLP